MRQRVSDLLHPVLSRLVAWEARRMMRGFRRSLAEARGTQERVLLAKVRRNAESEFGRRHGFGAIKSVEDFRRGLPVQTYADYEPYIERVRQGEFGAMFGGGQRLHMFAMTSGTTSRPKYIPVSEPFLKEYRRGWMTWGIQAFLDHEDAWEGRILQLVSATDDERAPCGLPCGAMSGLTAQVQRQGAKNIYLLPAAAAKIKDTASKYYVALLLALRRRTLMILSANPSTLLGLARTLDEKKEPLLRDLRDGRLSGAVEAPGAARRAVERRLRADRGRVAELERGIAAEGGLYAKTAWRMPFLGCWKGGTLSLYLREFPRYFGAAVVRDIGLIASEGRMTVPLGDEGSAGVLDIESNFFEFLPARDGERVGSETVLPEELEAGKEYFIVITNSAGLYRYDIGDLVRVTGMAGGSPLVEFLSKGAHYSSVTGEKLSEHQAVEAVNGALAEAGVGVSSYCLAPAWSEALPYYVLIVEEPEVGGAGAARRLAGGVDELLRRVNVEYNSRRESGRLGAVRVRLVGAGTWQAYDLATIAQRRRGIEQYKHKFLANDVGFEKGFAAAAEYGPED